MNGVTMYLSNVHCEGKEEVLYCDVGIQKEKGQEDAHLIMHAWFGLSWCLCCYLFFFKQYADYFEC